MPRYMRPKQYAKHVGVDVQIVREWMHDGKLKVRKAKGHHGRLIDSNQARLMTAKEYAKHVGADVRTIRRWMRNGLLKYKGDTGHHAHLIDSSQPRPKKRRKSHLERFLRDNPV